MNLTRILRRSLVHRRARSLSALTALTVSAAVATALLTLYASLDAKLHHEFRGFGANVVMTAPAFEPGAEYIAQEAARTEAGPPKLAWFYYAVATTDRGTSVVVAGVNFDAVRNLDNYWQVDRWPSSHGQALLGIRAAEFVGDEQNLNLTYDGHTSTFSSAGHIRTGADEDSRIYVDEQALRDWGVKPTVIELQIPGGEARVNQAMTALRKAFPTATVEPVRQLVEGESSIVDKTHALMFGAVLLIALTVAVSVLATLSASVLERRRDFALMKALGGSESQLMALFLLETLLLATGGILAGYLLGSFAAWLISEVNFHTATLPRLQVLPLVILLNLVIAAVAALFPIRSLRHLEPAALLKGE